MYKYLIALPLFLLLSCGPQIAGPPDAIPFNPPEEYREWYFELESCTGIDGDFNNINWFRVPHGPPGQWYPKHNIYILEGLIDRMEPMTVRHEMIHDLLQQGNSAHGDPAFNCV